jgi:hypothetical protein
MEQLEQEDFAQIWKDLYIWTKMLTRELSTNNIKLDKYSYWLYDRTLYLLDAFIPVHQQDNTAVQMILIRALFEIKVKASSYNDDPGKAVNKANKAIVDDVKNFIKIAKKGDSFTAQIIRSQVNLDHVSIGKPEKRPETIKAAADDADLSFDYELFYWLTSMFVHSAPLSFLILDVEDSKQIEIFTILGELASNNKLNSLIFIGNLLWVTEYLFGQILPPNCQDFLSYLRRSEKELYKQIIGLELRSDPNIPIGEILYTTTDGKEIRLKRRQRK